MDVIYIVAQPRDMAQYCYIKQSHADFFDAGEICSSMNGELLTLRHPAEEKYFRDADLE